VVATRVPHAELATVGAAEAHQLPNVGGLASEVENDLDKRWLDALVRIKDLAAAGYLASLQTRVASNPSKVERAIRPRCPC